MGLLGSGATISGETFSSGNATTTTQSVGFQAASIGGGGVINPQPGFNPALSLGRQSDAQHNIDQPDNTGCHYACAVNLPAGNNGATARHGLEMSWSGGRYLTNTNGAAVDFVVYESATGSTTAGDEAFMVALKLQDGTITSWRYEKADAHQTYLGSGDSATATGFNIGDFSTVGGTPLDSSAKVVAILIANMMTADRVSGADGQGTVGAFTNQAQGRANVAYASGAYDPDPLYIGITGNLVSPAAVPVPGSIPLFVSGLAGLAWLARRRKNQAAA
jgi:hypothetical protein